MSGRILGVAAVALLLVATRARAQVPPAQLEPLALVELEALALANNPTTEQARLGADAARARMRQAGAWPNPVIGYSMEEASVGGVDPRGQYGWFVEQTIPLGGKLRLREVAAEQAIVRAETAVDLQRRRVLASVRTLFYEVLIAERRVDVLEGLAALASEAVGVTAQLFNVGAADRPDFLESEVEAHRARLTLQAARNRLFAVRQHLAALAGDPAVAERPLAGGIDSSIPELERAAVVDTLLQQSPELLAANVALEQARANVALVRREPYPDLFVRAGTSFNRERDRGDPPVGWQGTLEAGISLPIFNRNQGAVAAAVAGETRALAEIRRVELELRSRVAVAFEAYLTALGAAEAYRDDIVPRADEAYRMYLARYQQMSAAYPQVLVAQRTLFEMSSAYLESLDRAWRAALALQELLPGDGLAPPFGDLVSIRAETGLDGGSQ